MSSPRLSVIIPVLNARYLGEATESIRRAVGHAEIIVVDDGSKDESAEALAGQDRSIIYVRQENAGPAAARNRGIELARGEFIGFLDADDLWTGNHPNNALTFLCDHGGVDGVLSQTQFLFSAADDSSKFAVSGVPFHSYQVGAAIVRRKVIEQVGGFDPSMRSGEDVDWFLRIREKGLVIATLPELGLLYRLHAVNRPKVYASSRAGLLDAFHHSLQRRREQPTPSGGSVHPHPLVSVIVPVFNGEAFIADAVASVAAQDYRPIEIIVVDDGSTDRTREVVQGLPQARLIEQPHLGAGVARNAGVRHATGDLIAFLDADDLWMPGKLTAQVEALAADPGLEAIYSHLVEFRQEEPDVDSAPRAAPVPGTMLIRREAFQRVGWFDERSNAVEGIDWHLRAIEVSLRSRIVPDIFYRRRVHPRNRSVTQRDPRAYLDAIKSSLDRRRAAKIEAANAD